jgi:hypothetical protein
MRCIKISNISVGDVNLPQLQQGLLIYVLISALKPQGLGILKDRLNLEYAASVDANSVHRALHILKAVPDLSGDYTCSVSTLQSEDIRTKSMLVFGK